MQPMSFISSPQSRVIAIMALTILYLYDRVCSLRNEAMRVPNSVSLNAMALSVGALAVSFIFATQANADHHGRYSRSYDVHGWGWDSRSGWYAGPLFNGIGHGHFRCYDTGFGWHSCPHYLPANASPKPPKGWWRQHFILPN
jgi:hypothetical protein